VEKEEEEEVQSEQASYGVLNQLGVEVSTHVCLVVFYHRFDEMRGLGLGARFCVVISVSVSGQEQTCSLRLCSINYS
jgi:hypothetical protein